MEVQIFGVRKSPDTRKALRFFAERRVKTHFVDLDQRAASPGELRRFVQRFGVEALLNRSSRRFADLGLAAALGYEWPSAQVLAAAATRGFIGSGVSRALFVLALRHLGTARASAYFSIAPFFGAGLAIVLHNEVISWQLVASGVLMAVGIWLHVTERHAHHHTHVPKTHSHAHIHDAHHQHTHENWDGREPHVHTHTHERLSHAHEHYPDLHHRHEH